MRTAFQMLPETALPAAGEHRQPAALKAVALIPLQLVGLRALNRIGFWAAASTGLLVPGKLIGMVGLYALLALGTIKLSWVEAAGPVLIRHLAFFFVPITVGLMGMGALFAAHAVGIAVALTVSAAIRVLLAGWVSQLLLHEAAPEP